MINPLDVLFGPSVVFRLRHQPKALARIAERVKPLLMAAVHPDKNHDVGPEAAAEVSEAYQVLLSTPPEELEELIEMFLAKQRGREEELKGTLRQLRDSNANLKQASEEKDRQIQNLRTSLSNERDRLYSWILSEHGLPSVLIPNGAIPRGEFHKYRVVVDHRRGKADKFFRGYEFDGMGHVVRVVKSNSQDIASGRTSLMRSEDSCLEVSSAHESHSFLLGSTTGIPHGMKLVEAVKDNLVQPFVSIGLHLVLCWVYKLGSHQELTKDPAGGQVVEIIPLE